MKNYIVLEIQASNDGNTGIIHGEFEDITDAKSDFYSKCSFAVKSQVLIHTIVLMNAAGGIVEGPKCFRHEPAPEPEAPEE